MIAVYLRLADGRIAAHRGSDMPPGSTPATDEEIGAWFRAHLERATAERPKAPGRRRKCCGDPPVWRWMGMDWSGKPLPLRLRLRWPVYAHRAAGCGCIIAMRDAWLRLSCSLRLRVLAHSIHDPRRSQH